MTICVAFRRALLAAVACGVLLAWTSGVAAVLFENNLVVNGNAEAGPATVDGSPVPFIPGWTTNNGTFTVVNYNPTSGFPAPTDPGPPDRGTNFFAGGLGATNSSAFQNIDISAAAVLIDTGKVACISSAWLGGYSSQADSAILMTRFLDATNHLLGYVIIGPVTSTNRNNATALLYRSTTNAVPSGTRIIQVLLIMTRVEGNYNDGYADDISIVLTGEPRLILNPSASNSTLTWPTNFNYWHLQSATALSGSWSNFPVSTQIVGTNFSASVSPTNRQQFFRLEFP